MYLVRYSQIMYKIANNNLFEIINLYGKRLFCINCGQIKTEATGFVVKAVFHYYNALWCDVQIPSKVLCNRKLNTF